MSSFDIEETVQSQYSDSPHLKALVNSFWKALDPEADIEKLYNDMINIDTAVGFGLDVWGRIVAIGREYVAVDEQNKYFGFDPEGAINERLDNFNNAPFYKQIDGKIRLSDNAYRTYILIKAMINIGDSTLASINLMLKELLPDSDMYCIHVDTMVLRIVVQSMITDADKQALLNLPWLPAGVGLEFYQVVTPTFGFNGSELHPFNQGTFATYYLQQN
jgi:hypothetical protein